MTNPTRWQYRHPQPVTTGEQLRAAVLANRHWSPAELTAQFNHETFAPVAAGVDPQALRAAADRLRRARDRREKVVIFGDYDVDGNAATAIMWQGLAKIGLVAQPFIPHRLRHGYGMSPVALEEILASGRPDLIVTVDNGITAGPALEFCRAQAIDVVITDHHQPDPQHPPATPWVVHTTQLAGAGVAWLLIWQLLQAEPGGPATWSVAADWLDLVAVATVVDQVPLVGINRQLVKLGLAQLRVSQRPGIQALCASAYLRQPTLSTRDIGFGLGPRINAVGRLSNTLEALRLLCTQKLGYAKHLATNIERINQHRQELTADMLATARQQIDPDHLDRVVVVASDDFHEGIIGLIASQLVDRYHRPAIAVALGPELAKASARSVEGINITDFIRQFRDRLVNFGGHALAAGFSARRADWPELADQLRATANHQLPVSALTPILTLEAPVRSAALFDFDLATFLDQLEPFGAGNPELQISVAGRVVETRCLGRDGQHLKITLSDDPSGPPVETLFWGFRERGLEPPAVGEPLVVAGQLGINTYRGQSRPQLIGTEWQVASARPQQV